MYINVNKLTKNSFYLNSFMGNESVNYGLKK